MAGLFISLLSYNTGAKTPAQIDAQRGKNNHVLEDVYLEFNLTINPLRGSEKCPVQGWFAGTCSAVYQVTAMRVPGPFIDSLRDNPLNADYSTL